MTSKHNDNDLPELFRSLDREMERERGREAPFDSKAVFHQLLGVRQSRRRRRHRIITGCTTVLLLTLGAIGLQMSNKADSSIAKQESQSTSRSSDCPTLAETIANDPELLSAQLAIAEEHQARLELIALRSRNAMNSSNLAIDPSLIADFHSKAYRSVEIPDVSEILSGKLKAIDP